MKRCVTWLRWCVETLCTLLEATSVTQWYGLPCRHFRAGQPLPPPIGIGKQSRLERRGCSAVSLHNQRVVVIMGGRHNRKYSTYFPGHHARNHIVTVTASSQTGMATTRAPCLSRMGNRNSLFLL